MKRVILHHGQNVKRILHAPVKKSGVIYSATNVNKQVINRVAQPTVETNMQKHKEGTAESIFNPTGGFERF